MDREQEPWTTEDLVDSSGKMMVLERLLDELFARGHKVLLFSQFRTVLDIIEVSVLYERRPGTCVDGRENFPIPRRGLRS